MKALIMFSALALATTAFADVPRPPVSNAVEVAINGTDARELYETLNVKVRNGSSLRTFYTKYKIFRSETGLTQIVCEQRTSTITDEKTTTSCKLSKSTDGNPLPEFRIRIVMG